MFDIQKPRVLIHNLTLKGIERVPGVLDFDQRAIVAARPGDIVVTRRKPDGEFLQYLTSLGWDFSGVTFLSPTINGEYRYNSVFADVALQKTIRNKPVTYVDTYQNTDEERKFGKKVGLPVYADAKVGLAYGTKSGFRILARSLGMSVPQGYESVKSVEEATENVAALFKRGVKRVIVKIDEGLSGAGQTMIGAREYAQMSEAQRNDLFNRALTKVPQFGASSAVSIEEWMEGAVASPSIQMEVRPDGRIDVLSIKDQILEGEEKWYIGCIYPTKSLSAAGRREFIRQANVFADALRKYGFIGFFGLDAILFKDGSFVWVEANIRKPGTYYPRVIAEKLNGGTLAGMHYVACDITVPYLKGKPFEDLKRLLTSFLYPMNHRKHGIILYNTGALEDAGRFDIVCIGLTASDAVRLHREVKQHIHSYGQQKGGPMTTTSIPHYVRDMSLAAEGKRRIEWANQHMPVLASIRKRFAKEKPLKNIHIDLSCHITAETANLARTLQAGGAVVVAHSGNPVSTQDDVAASLVADYGIMTFGAKNIDRDVNRKNVEFALNQKPDIAIDDGAEFISVLYKKYPEQAKRMLGGTEETTTGIHRLRSLEKSGLLKFPVIGVNDAMTKHMFDNRYGTGQSTIDGIMRATNMLLAGKIFVVVGYGWCGKGVALRARGMGCHTIVCEVDPVKALEAVMDGFVVMPVHEACKVAEILITVTGGMHVVDAKDLGVLKDGALIGNSGHFNVEINLLALGKMTEKVTRVRHSLDEYKLKDGRKIYLIGEGRLANLAAAEGHPPEVMDMSFANQALSAEYLAKHRKKLENKMYDVPREIDEQIARLKLASMGIRTNTLTREQDEYLNQWEKGGYGLI